MILTVICVMDTQAAAFNRPMFVPAIGLGLRAIADEVNRAAPDNPLYAHTADFRVFELGKWDDHSGIFTCHQLPQLVCDCNSLRSHL